MFHSIYLTARRFVHLFAIKKFSDLCPKRKLRQINLKLKKYCIFLHLKLILNNFSIALTGYIALKQINNLCQTGITIIINMSNN